MTKPITKKSDKINFLKDFTKYQNFSDINSWFDAQANKKESFKRILTMTRDNEKHFIKLFGTPKFTVQLNGNLKVWEVIFENNPATLVITSSSRGSEYMFSEKYSTDQERQNAMQCLYDLLYKEEKPWEPPEE